MCSEFILAFLYFSILFSLNYLFFRSLNPSLKKIILSLKLKTIVQKYKLVNSPLSPLLLCFLIYLLKDASNMNRILNKLFNVKKSKDIFIIGKFYDCFASTSSLLKEQKTIFFFKLLTLQYLPSL